ncbi:exodeoxyribonuclease III [Roseivivax sediminis]|uniref:Exodeoxyribonuclease III n=1 Tax=Roseivivax sediminis TaxID=936889 RepID=A0A1I1WYQ6_9RHOB|nr:exodeoxyribonuclease III [Roseivivax sediminis]SFD98593.1 Exodeoxyribonuclease III [Roseivivax sediminis]
MKVATFNINGIKARLAALIDWLDRAAPDVVVLQEIKSLDENFPAAEIEARGYAVETHGQKSFNGVAILSKLPMGDVARGLPGDEDDDHARWIEATVTGKHRSVRVCGLYLPNGNPVSFDAAGRPEATGKYGYKLSWMARLEARARDLRAAEMPALMAGDYNVIPQEEDAANPKEWVRDALFLLDSRAAFRRVLNLGFTEAIGTRQPGPGHYTFWDYQARSWERNNGIRIDHVLLTPEAADLLTDAGIDRDERDREKPSDHVPVWVDLAA